MNVSDERVCHDSCTDCAPTVCCDMQNENGGWGVKRYLQISRSRIKHGSLSNEQSSAMHRIPSPFAKQPLLTPLLEASNTILQQVRLPSSRLLSRRRLRVLAWIHGRNLCRASGTQCASCRDSLADGSGHRETVKASRSDMLALRVCLQSVCSAEDAPASFRASPYRALAIKGRSSCTWSTSQMDVGCAAGC